MSETVGALADKVRSKNAGPYWITVDVFCGEAFGRLAEVLSAERISAITGAQTRTVKRFALPELGVVKLSLPRPAVQGSREDRDMHGAALAALVAEMEVPPLSAQ